MNRRRPAFRRLLQDAKAQHFQIILCKSLARFTRDMELVERYLHGYFPLWGIRFRSLTDGVDSLLPSNKKARQIYALLGEWYLEDLSENIRMVFDAKRKDGIYIGGFPLYGYRLDQTKKGRLQIDTEAATMVQSIFSCFLSGKNTEEIAQMLNAQQIPNPSIYKQYQGQGYRNGHLQDLRGIWHRSTISRILHNPMYTGTMVQGRYSRPHYKAPCALPVPPEHWYVFPETHDAIIDQETFDQVQAQLAHGRKRNKQGLTQPLSGLVTCQSCGGLLHQNSVSHKGETKRYLRCTKPNCPARLAGKATSIRLDVLLEHIAQRLEAHATQYLPAGLVSLPPAFPAKQSHRTDAIARLYADSHRFAPAQFEAILQSLLKQETQPETVQKQDTQRYDFTDHTWENLAPILPRLLLGVRIAKLPAPCITILWRF